MPTPHIEAKEGEIAEIVLMPGDPLRAKFIAEKYLTDAKLVNKIRNMFAYTGYYKGKKLTVMGSGMGMPSMGIYSYELYKFYNVQKIIRIGSCGSFNKDINILDIILAEKAYSETNFAYTLSGSKNNVENADVELTNAVEGKATELGYKIIKGTITTCDCFDWYVDSLEDILNRVPKDIQVLGSEMEAFALFHIANKLDRQATCLATVVDSHYSKEQISSEDREKSLNKMIELALEAII